MSDSIDDFKALLPKQDLTEQEFRTWLDDVESRMAVHEAGVVKGAAMDEFLPLKHTFTPGLYTRQITMPKGAIVVSRIHLHEHPFIISKGKVLVYDGRSTTLYEAPYQGVTKPGTKRLLFIFEDTVWTTFHVTNHSTLEEVSKPGVVVVDTWDEFDKVKETLLCHSQRQQ